jgi:protein-tyrosine phosphatase
MRYSVTLSVLGITLMGAGALRGDWLIPVLWLGGNFLALGIAHGIGAPRIFGKRPDGSLAPWGWLSFLPLLALTSAVWHLSRMLMRESAYNSVTENLVVGRRLLSSELPREFDNYVDLTAEFAEPRAIRSQPGFVCFPILDGGVPTPEALREAISRLRSGTTFVHCAQGHGRTGLFALAVLLRSGIAKDVEEGLQMLRKVRPGIRLNRDQRLCIEEFAAELLRQHSSP